MDDLYNNLKVYEPEVKGISSSSSSTQNMAFVSSSNNNTSSSNEAINAAHRVTTTSTQVNTAYSTNTDNLSDVVIFPAPYTGNFMPPMPDLSFIGLDEFVNKLVVENRKSDEEVSEIVRKNDAPIIEEWVLDSEEENAARTILADSKLPTTFWAEVVNTACYVQNRVLVVKPHNKTPYELFHGKTPTLSFMRPFGYPVTILNTIDHLGKFDGKVDEGFFIRYSLNSKAFRVFNSRKRIVEENLHIRLSENTTNVAGSGQDWLFDIDALTRIMNYELIVAGTQSNGFTGTKASDNTGQARKETEPVKDYILQPLWTADPPFSQDPKSSHDDGSKPSSDDGKKVD
ncbi:ribonuclease H-like domain-containing protein [Tanacetum coccineum]